MIAAQAALLDAIQTQPCAVLTLIVPAPPTAPKLALIVSTETTHPFASEIVNV